VDAVLALQASAGNAAVTRQLQRMSFARFSSWGPLSNWGSYSKEETELLRRETELARFLATLEPWAASDAAIMRELTTFSGVQKGTIAEPQYKDASQGMSGIEDRVRVRRAALLNENPNRGGEAPVFKNHHPDALVGEIEQFLGRRGIDASAFLLNVPIPGENDAFEAERAHAKSDADLEREFETALQQRVAQFHAKIASEGELLWVYSIEGILGIGSKDENKHSVVGRGSDVWAAGTVRLKIDEGETHFGRYRTAQQKIGFFTEMIAKLEQDTTIDESKRKHQIMEFKANLAYQSGDADQAKAEYEKLGFDPEQAGKAAKTVIVDFDSGHYTPSKAWARAAWAWRNLGYKVEFNPHGRTA
jgi:hypothetical protein